MGKFGRKKVLDPESGRVTVTTREERWPRSTEVLMCNGFGIILLNLVFGLLPTTLYGSRLNYFRCSIAQAYAVVFGVCMIILSAIFLPLSIMTEWMQNPERNGRTDIAVLLLGKITHVCGFLFLLIRGYYVARKLPVIWGQLAKLMQISVIELHGKKYRGLKKLRRFATFAILTYVACMIGNEFSAFMQEIDAMMPQFFIYYNLQFMKVTNWNFVTIHAGFYIWKLCSFSHILVSIMAGFLIVAVTVCLHAGNDHLLSIFEDEQNLLLIKPKKKLKILAGRDNDNYAENDKDESKNKLITALNRIKDIHVVAESLLSSMSSIFGVSLIIEVLILIANLLVDVFYMLMPMISGGGLPMMPDFPDSTDNETVIIYRKFFRNYLASVDDEGGDEGMEENIGGSGGGFFSSTYGKMLTLFGEAFIHSYFFYKLCCRTTEMVNEAKQPLQILKTIPYANFSKKVQHQLSILRGDLASNAITLSAANYFQINKFTLTSVTSALTTYIIVLLQFSQQDKDKAKLEGQ